MPGWGIAPWGTSPWGTGAGSGPVVLDLGISAVNVYAIDLLEVTFQTEVKVTSALVDPSSYTVTPLDSAAPSVSVLDVRVPNGPATDVVYLTISPISSGVAYDVAVVVPVLNRSGIELSGTLTGRMLGRRTKIDSICSTRQPIYDLRPTAVIRGILNAIGREDDRIGGNQDEGEEVLR